MDDALGATAVSVRAAMPCSIELPAGTGKTQVVAALAAVAAEGGERALVLTHTNAGVDVLRRRLREFGVPGADVRVETIASWSFDLIRRYPTLSGVTVGAEPRWAQSSDYYAGAAATTRAAAIRRVLQASYGLAIVDEYQDCVVEQHELVLALHEALPVCVFGDRLQNIFNFGDNVTVRWGADVLPVWPAVDLPIYPWRWEGHNPALGQWLLDIRKNLYAGEPIDLDSAPVRCVPAAVQRAAIRACYAQPVGAGSVVAIGQWANDCAHVASCLNGSYGVMEELEGSFMVEFAEVVDTGDPGRIAVATLNFAKKCASGVAKKLDAPLAAKIAKGESVAHLKRPGAERQLGLLSDLLTNASPARVRETLQAISQLAEARMFRREAWRDMLQALTMAASGGELRVADAVVRIRNHTRIIGRPREQRVVSRPLLIKGLEYDHAVVLNADVHSATNLYVALTRGRKGLTIVSRDRYLRPGAPQL